VTSGILRLARRFSLRPRETVITRADRAVRSGQFELAAKLYREALDRNPRNPPIWVQCGHLLKHSGDLKGAEAAYARAFALDPSSQDAARELMAFGWTEDRLLQLRAAADTRIEAAQAGMNSERDRGALAFGFRFWRQASVITLADRARDAGQWDRALQLYQKALRRNPEQAAIWVQCGHVLKGLGRLEPAENAYRRAIAHDPKSSDAQLHLGHVLKLRRRAKAAEAAYLRAFALDPRLAAPLIELDGLGWSQRALAGLRMAASPTGLQPGHAAPDAG
jgi:tetratricopeptide (TPR) repeat protein